MQILSFADVMFDVGAVIGNRAVDIGAATHQVAKFTTETIADRPHFAIALF